MMTRVTLLNDCKILLKIDPNNLRYTRLFNAIFFFKRTIEKLRADVFTLRRIKTIQNYKTKSRKGTQKYI